jgi:hypothetical protein
VIIRFGQQETQIPPDVRDEIITWFREQGRIASVVWNDLMRCAEVRIRFKDDDPRLGAYRAGRIREDFDPLWLHYEDKDSKLVGYNLSELGASGVRNILDQGNLMSGRGEYRDLYAAIKATNKRNEKLKDSIRKAALDGVRERSHLKRRKILELPQVPVGIDLKSN